MLRFPLSNKPSFQFRIITITLGILFFLLFKSGFSQCNFGFDIASPGPFCPTNDSIKLTAWDTLQTTSNPLGTGGCVIEPTFIFKVKLDFDSETDNYIDFYQNGKYLVRIDYTSRPTQFTNNILISIVADYVRPTDVYKAVFCTSDFSGSYAYEVIDRAINKVTAKGTIIGANGCDTIHIPPYKGIANFSGPGVSNHHDGIGYFHPDKAGPGNHTIKYYFNNQNGFQDSTTMDVTVYTPPVITINNPTIVSGCSVTLTATSDAQTYFWSTGDVGSSINVSPSVTTTYTVRGTDINGCIGNGSCVVTVVQQANITVNSPTICSGDAVVLKANGAVSYTWNTGQVIDSIVVKPNVTTTYTVTGSIPSCSMTSSAQSVVTVIPPPVVKINNAAICYGQKAVLTATGVSTYVWNTGDFTSSINVSPLTTTTYTVTASDKGSCKVIVSGVVTVLPFIPPPAVSSNSPVCEGSILKIKAKEKDSLINYIYTWSGPNNFSSNQQIVTINNVPASATGNYFVSAMINNCSSKDTSLDFKVYPEPSGFLRADTSICGTVSFTVNALGKFKSYLWQDGTSNSSIQINDFGVFWLKVTDSLNCNATDTFRVIKNCSPVLYVPNAFIPVSNSENNTFTAKGSYISKFSMDIFNRWGALLFHSDNINSGWDGKLNNTNCLLGSYVYVIHYEGLVNNHNEKYTKIGSFTLLR